MVEATADAAAVNLVLDDVTGEQVSKNELKKRKKQRENEEKKRVKEEAKKVAEAEKAAKGEVKKPKAGVIEEEEVDPAKYTDNRKAWVQAQRDNGKNPYPHKFSRSHRIDVFRELFEAQITENIFLEDVTVQVTGRI